MSVFNDCMWAIEREHAMVPCPWCGAKNTVNSASKSVDVGAHLCSSCRDKLVAEIRGAETTEDKRA